MVGNGPFMIESPRTDQEIVLVPNPEWDGTKYDEALGLPEQPYLEQLTFTVGSDLDTAYNALEAGEGDIANFAAGSLPGGAGQLGDTLDVPILGSYYFEINRDDPVVGGETT